MNGLDKGHRGCTLMLYVLFSVITVMFCCYWSCLLYQHLPVTRFPCALACEARHFLLDGEPRPLAVRQPTPAHPVMADLSGREVGQPFVYCQNYHYLPICVCWRSLASIASQIQGNLEGFLRLLIKGVWSSLIWVGAGWYTTLSYGHLSWSTF